MGVSSPISTLHNMRRLSPRMVTEPPFDGRAVKKAADTPHAEFPLGNATDVDRRSRAALI